MVSATMIIMTTDSFPPTCAARVLFIYCSSFESQSKQDKIYPRIAIIKKQPKFFWRICSPVLVHVVDSVSHPPWIGASIVGGGGIIASTIIPSLYLKNLKSMPTMKTTIPNQELVQGIHVVVWEQRIWNSTIFHSVPLNVSTDQTPLQSVKHHHSLNMPAGAAGETKTFDSSFISFSGRGEIFQIDDFELLRETLWNNFKLQMLK